MVLKQFDLALFLNKFYISKMLDNKKFLNKLKIIYGLNFYSILQLSIYFGLKLNYKLNYKFFNFFFWTNFFNFLKKNFNFFLYNKKLRNIKKIKMSKNYKGWRHIFNLPVRGQRNHTNAKTRKKYKVI